MIRQAVKILSKERLVHMLLELSEFHAKLKERKKHAQAVLKEFVRLDRAKKYPEAQAMNLKHHILRDIVKRLMQKIVIYSLQLRVYHKQETCILFDELFSDLYKKRCLKYTLSQMQIHCQIQKMKRERHEFIYTVMQQFHKARVLNCLRGLRLTRSLMNERRLNIMHKVQANKMHKVFLSLKQHTDFKAMQTLDKEVLKMFLVNKYKMKLFIRWREGHLRLKEIKAQALGMVKEAQSTGSVKGLLKKSRAPMS